MRERRLHDSWGVRVFTALVSFAATFGGRGAGSLARKAARDRVARVLRALRGLWRADQRAGREISSSAAEARGPDVAAQLRGVEMLSMLTPSIEE